MNIEKHTVEIDWGIQHHGWGNGYVGVPPNHKWYGVNYHSEYIGFKPFGFETICMNDLVDVHGSITYSAYHKPNYDADGLWWVGFDTVHFDDNLQNWSKEAVEAETKRLYQQALKAGNKNIFDKLCYWLKGILKV